MKSKQRSTHRNKYHGIICGIVPSEGASLCRSLTSEDTAKTKKNKNRTVALISVSKSKICVHALIMIKVQLSAIIGVLTLVISLSQGYKTLNNTNGIKNGNGM